MKEIIIIILLFFSLNSFSQSECYTSNKYLYLDNPSENLREVKNEIGICFNSVYFSIFLNGKINVFPIMYESIERQKNSDGYLQYSFLSDKTNLYSVGYYRITITYSKERLITIDNSGKFYAIKYKTDKYLIISEKKIKNIDSLLLMDKKQDSIVKNRIKLYNDEQNKMLEFQKQAEKNRDLEQKVWRLNDSLRKRRNFLQDSLKKIYPKDWYVLWSNWNRPQRDSLLKAVKKRNQ